MSRRAQRAPRIGYLVNAYPVVTEKFLVNELRTVEAAGVDVAILATARERRRPGDDGDHRIQAPVRRPPTLLPLAGVVYPAAHLQSLRRAPAAYLSLLREDLIRPAVRWARRRDSRSWKAIRHRGRLFLLSPLVASWARRLGVVHLHAYFAKDPLEIAARVRWLCGTRYSFAAHAKDLYTAPKRRLAKRLAKARFAVTCHRHGETTLRRLAGRGQGHKIHRVPHGVDRRIFRPVDRRSDPGLILGVGRLTPKKGFDTLIDACAGLAAPRYRCVILGEGRLESELRRRIRRRGLEGVVEIRGFVSQPELAEWYRRAAVVVLPARVLADGNRDGIPNVVREAMACGAAVVGTPVGGIPEAIRDGVDGRLVAPDDAAALRAVLQELLEKPALRRRLGDAAARSVERLDRRQTARPLIRLWRRTLRRARRAPAAELVTATRQRLVAKATQRLGRSPTLRPGVEQTIARSVAPGLRANAWRPDLQRLCERRMWDEVFKARRAGELLRFARGLGVSLGRDTPVLDLGSGRGGLAVALRARGIPAVSLDLRLRNCRVGRLRASRYDLALPAVAARAERLPLADRSFRLVCLLEVLEHVADPAAVLAEARRVCRPDGLCVATVVNRWAHLDPHYHLWGVNFLPRRWAEAYIALRGRQKRSWRDQQTLSDMHYYSWRGFRRLAGKQGFEVHDPQSPHGTLRGRLHRCGRDFSLGFNTLTVVLVPR